MSALRARARLISWIAVVAMLLAALAPALIHALASASGSTWVEVCTTEGTRWAQADGQGSPSAPASGHALEHCPYCSLHTPTLGVPPTTGQVRLPVRRADDIRRAFLAAPSTLHAWVSAQPRAPPPFS